MHLIQLRYFLKVAELRSFTKAAEALHIAQPAVTRQIQQLEEELGVQLLLRHSKGAEPTEAGLRLRAGAEAMLRLATETRAQVLASASDVVGDLRVGFPPSVGATVIASAAARFHTTYPAVRLRLGEQYSNALRDALLDDELDLAIITNPIDHPQLDLQHLYVESLWVIYGPRLNSAFQGSEISLAQLANYPLIQLRHGNNISELIDSHARAQQLQFKVSVEAESLPVIKALLKAGSAVHVSPYTAYEQELRAGELAGKQLEGLHVTRCLARRIDRPRTLAQTAFVTTLLAEVNALAAASGGLVRC